MSSFEILHINQTMPIIKQRLQFYSLFGNLVETILDNMLGVLLVEMSMASIIGMNRLNNFTMHTVNRMRSVLIKKASETVVMYKEV